MQEVKTKRVKFKRTIFQDGIAYACFYIDNLTTEEYLPKCTLEEVKNMIICPETIRAYKALMQLDYYCSPICH